MENEKRRIEELRQRAADEGRALWEEKRTREHMMHCLESGESSISSLFRQDSFSEKEIGLVNVFFCCIY